MTRTRHPERAVEPYEEGENRSGPSPPEPIGNKGKAAFSAAFSASQSASEICEYCGEQATDNHDDCPALDPEVTRP